MSKRKKSNLHRLFSQMEIPDSVVMQQVSADPEGYAEAGAEDCEERVYTPDGEEITDACITE